MKDPCIVKIDCSKELLMAVACALISSSCVGTRVGVGYRDRDPYYRDEHRWDSNEIGLYLIAIVIFANSVQWKKKNTGAGVMIVTS